MKLHLQIKKEIMRFDSITYLLWLICTIVGYIAYLDAPAFIIQLGDIFSFFRKTGELLWGLTVAFLMGVIAVFATKIGTQLWEDHGKKWYNKIFKKKKKK